MTSKIITMQNCPKCRLLKDMCPNTEAVELDQETILAFARKVGIQSMPFVVTVGEPAELAKVIKHETEHEKECD